MIPDDFTGGYSLRASRVLDVDSALAEFARGVQVRVGSRLGLERLRDALSAHRGSAPVWVRYSNREACATMRLGADWQVRATPGLLEHLGSVEGVEEARILFARDLH